MNAQRRLKEKIIDTDDESIISMAGENENLLICTGKLIIVVSPTLARDFEVHGISATEVELRFADGYPPRRIKLSSVTRENIAKAISDIFSMKVVLN